MRGEFDVDPPWTRAMWGVGLAVPLLAFALFFLFDRPAPKPHPSRLASPALWKLAYPERP